VAEAIGCTAATEAPVVAVDIPSGVDGATGEVAGEAVRAAVTVTFQAVKPGHVLPPGSGHTGRLEVADIGLPVEATRWGVSEAADLAGLVPLPEPEQHKRSRGVLLLVGGSPGMGGAPTLMGLAARRAGTGLLVLAVPASVADRVGAAVPEALTVALPESSGGLARNADDACRRWLGEATAIGVGPGLGRADGTQKVVRGLLAAYDGPAVIDADALFALGTGEPLAERRGPTLVTPHAGEFARLAPGAPGTRLEQAADRAGAWRVTVLLKGDHTVIADPGGRLAVNPTGVPALATGGTGDVLTGLTGSLLAQGLDPFDAGRLGAWVHGRAGALAAADLGPVSVAAGDVAGHLPGAFRELLRSGRGDPEGVPR
jgi:NAD(P)H-hydrate epimerase